MNFKPQSERQLAEAMLLPTGIYDFEVLHGTDKNSKSSGKPMIELKLKITQNGMARLVTDYLLAETPRKLKHAAECMGLTTKYLTGSLTAADFRGRRGKLKLSTQTAKDGFAAKNVVSDYIGLGVKGLKLLA